MARWLREGTQQLIADRARRLRNSTSVDNGETSESFESEGFIPHERRRRDEFEEMEHILRDVLGWSADEIRAWGSDMMQDPPPENAEATFAPTEELQFSEDRCFCHHIHFLRCENLAGPGDFWCEDCRPLNCSCDCAPCGAFVPETEVRGQQDWQGQPDEATVPPDEAPLPPGVIRITVNADALLRAFGLA